MSAMPRYPRNPEYEHVDSHVKVMTSGLQRENRHVVAAATEHLQQLSAMAQHMNPGEIEALMEKFPAVSQQWLRELAQPSGATLRSRSRDAVPSKLPRSALPASHAGTSDKPQTLW